MSLTLSLALLVCGSLAARAPYYPRSNRGNGYVHIPMSTVPRDAAQLRSRDTINATALNEDWLYVIEGRQAGIK